MLLSSPPDVVVVVLDCGRNLDFPGGAEPVPSMPFLEGLRRESVAFPRAVSPSAWTVPGHASLFTGLYPWEHRVHMKAALKLDPSLPTMASLLKEEGYATLSLSANGFVGPEFGLLKGFDQAAWGVWWEKFLRLPDRETPMESTWAPRQTPPAALVPIRGSAKGSSGSDGGRGVLLRFAHSLVKGKDPIWMGPLANALNLGVQRVRAPSPGNRFPISPWIEPTFSRWLRERRPEERIFCFINFLEPHEPYIVDTQEMSNPWTWGRYALQRTDKASFYAGRWRPSRAEFHRLRTLYRSAVGSLDARLRAIVEALRATGRWENTLFLVTGDHGQAFGEHGYLFHAARIWEPVVRVPLWVRWPHGAGGGATGTGWASLIDILPTVLEATGIRRSLSPTHHSLSTLVSAERPEPVYTMADGLQGRAQVERIAAECVPTWDTPWVAGYTGRDKLLYDVEHDRWSAYEVESDYREERDLFPSDPARWATLSEGVRQVASRLTMNPPTAVTADVDALLKSWGYD
jgi:arylsulfatase A-like enzyme